MACKNLQTLIQIIKNKLNVWYVMHENEHYIQEIQEKKEIQEIPKNEKLIDYSKMNVQIIENENDTQCTYL